MKYEIGYRGKKYYHRGADSAEAIAKFENRKVFGRPLAENLQLQQYDGQTRGRLWAIYLAGWLDQREIVSATLVGSVTNERIEK